jgi:hypothetical protein
MKVTAKAAACLAAAALLAACPPPPDDRSTTGGAPQAIRFERYCTPPGLSPSLRHTFVLVDEHSIARTDTAEDFGQINAKLRNVVIGFATPDAASITGLMDHRERLSILLLPRDGTAAKLLFTGCLPSLSADELTAADRDGSAVATFFTGGVRQDISEAARTFRSRVTSALILAARAAPGPAEPETGVLAQSQLVQSLLASGQLINGENGVPRVLLLANLAQFDLGGASTPEAARRNGFTDGQTLALDLGRAELHVFLVEGESATLARDYARAFFLTRHANLMTWADDTPSSMPAAPVVVERYDGEAQYPREPEPIQIRVAADRNGALVNSWMILRGVENRSIPMTGRRVCNAEGVCSLRSDDGGFAQAWSPNTSATPEFDRLLPFVGMREWEITTQAQTLRGRVFDPTVRIGAGAGENSFNLNAAVPQNAGDGVEATF